MRVYQSLIVSLFLSTTFVSPTKAEQWVTWGDYSITIPYMEAGIRLDNLKTYEKTTIPLETIATDLVVKGCTLYILSSAIKKVLLYDLPKKTYLKSLPVGDDPRHLYVKDERVFVTNVGSKDITVINTQNKDVESSTPIGAPCTHLRFGATKAYAYTISQGKKYLVVIDLLTLTKKKKISLKGIEDHTNISDVLVDGDQAFIALNALRDVHLHLYFIDQDEGVLIHRLDLVGPKNASIQIGVPNDQSISYFGSAKPIDLYNEFIIYEGIGYLFSGEGIFTCTLYDLATGERVRTFPFPYCHGKLLFTPTHVLLAGQKVFPRYPSERTFQVMQNSGQLVDYGKLCPGAFDNSDKSYFSEKLTEEDEAFFSHLSATASLCQDHFYEILEPIETLYALTKTKDNRYLHSTEWTVRHKKLLRQVFVYLWQGDCAKAHMMVGLFLELKDPTITALHKTLAPSKFMKGLKSLFSIGSSSSSSSTSSTSQTR